MHQTFSKCMYKIEAVFLINNNYILNFSNNPRVSDAPRFRSFRRNLIKENGYVLFFEERKEVVFEMNSYRHISILTKHALLKKSSFKIFKFQIQ